MVTVIDRLGDALGLTFGEDEQVLDEHGIYIWWSPTTDEILYLGKGQPLRRRRRDAERWIAGLRAATHEPRGERSLVIWELANNTEMRHCWAATPDYPRPCLLRLPAALTVPPGCSRPEQAGGVASTKRVACWLVGISPTGSDGGLLNGTSWIGPPTMRGSNRLTNVDFIERARAVHGDYYDYSDVVYVNLKTAVTIRCPRHGSFNQVPHWHIGVHGSGCPRCVAHHQPTPEEWISRARAVHGDRYDYTHTIYKRSDGYVTIICPDHGEFRQRAAGHAAGKGCAKCRGLNLTTAEWIERASAVHGDYYDYTTTEYLAGRRQVAIVCRHHGPFSVTASGHLAGTGCSECGPSDLTTAEWIERARAVHGDRYDYSVAEYTPAGEPVTIICSTHGEFLQDARTHTRGMGCNRCATTAWIERARAVHGDRYDYSAADVVTLQHRVTIICATHGEFRQQASTHAAGNGCAKCRGLNLTTAEWIARARAVHGDRYDYSAVDYRGANRRVTIVCTDHGPFAQLAHNHITQRSHCPKCAGRYSPDTSEWIELAKAVHGDRYDYSAVDYQGALRQVTIICPLHGPFQQIAQSHLAGRRCSRCAGRHRLTTHEWIERARAVHGDRYDYSAVDYQGANRRVTIICPNHGSFQQTPNAHTNKRTGCRTCWYERSRTAMPE